MVTNLVQGSGFEDSGVRGWNFRFRIQVSGSSGVGVPGSGFRTTSISLYGEGKMHLHDTLAEDFTPRAHDSGVRVSGIRVWVPGFWFVWRGARTCA